MIYIHYDLVFMDYTLGQIATHGSFNIHELDTRDMHLSNLKNLKSTNLLFVIL